MAVEQQDRDSYTGYLTTGHEWNGIRELNTPVPRVVYFFLTLAFLFSVGYWILMPAWPLGVTYTKGFLGIDQRNVVAASLKDAAEDRSVWTKKIETESFAAVQSDPKMMAIVREAGHTLFGDNCAACHGHDAKAARVFRTWPRRPGSGAASRRTSSIPSASASIPRTRIPMCRRCRRSGATKCYREPTS